MFRSKKIRKSKEKVKCSIFCIWLWQDIQIYFHSSSFLWRVICNFLRQSVILFHKNFINHKIYLTFSHSQSVNIIFDLTLCRSFLKTILGGSEPTFWMFDNYFWRLIYSSLKRTMSICKYMVRSQYDLKTYAVLLIFLLTPWRILTLWRTLMRSRA